MFQKVILKHGGMLMFIPHCYKNHNMCNKAADNYSHALGSVPNRYKTQKTCNENVRASLSAIQFVSDRFITQEKYDKAINACPFVFYPVSD